MGTINVSIPDPVQQWVEDRIHSGEYANVSDYLVDLIRHDREQHTGLVDALIEGENSGISSRSIDQIVAEAKAKLRNGQA